MPRMGEGKGTSHATARRIFRRELAKLLQNRADVREREARGRPAGECLIDLIRMQEASIAGKPPAGVEFAPWWRQVREWNTKYYSDGEGI